MTNSRKSKRESRSLSPVRQNQATGFGMTGKAKGDGRRLQVRAESQQTAIAILHHELAAVPWHVAKSAREFHALGSGLRIKCVGTFNDAVRGEQFVAVFVPLAGWRLGAAR